MDLIFLFLNYLAFAFIVVTACSEWALDVCNDRILCMKYASQPILHHHSILHCCSHFVSSSVWFKAYNFICAKCFSLYITFIEVLGLCSLLPLASVIPRCSGEFYEGSITNETSMSPILLLQIFHMAIGAMEGWMSKR